MILVADSGSSKTDWIVNMTNGEVIELSTKGINPFFINEKEIARIFSQDTQLRDYADSASEVYFFGEGCNTPDKREQVSNGLSLLFKNAFINVESDAIGSAYATCGSGTGFTCVLGTASNIAFYNGTDVEYGRHGLGFIIGDEGSGAWYGKRLIVAYLHEKMPRELRKSFTETYRLDRESVIRNVYQRPLPNIWLSSFAPFLSAHRGHEYVESIIEEGLELFVATHIMLYPNYGTYPCHFVGSIAWNFRDVLERVCNKHHIRRGKVLAHPIHELSKYIMEEVIHAED